MSSNSRQEEEADDRNSTFGSDDEDGQSWRGCSMDEIHRHLNAFELEHVPPVRPSDAHTVLHHWPIRAADTEPPRPLRGQHKWDAHHVRLPCSAKSQYPVTEADGNVSIDSRWEMIERALLRPIATSHELEDAILAYNSRYKDQWKFRALHKLFEEELDESEKRVFFEDLLPRIVRLALRMPDLVQCAIPLLKQGRTHSITLTQQQIACLLANAFLCTYPRRNTMKRKSEYSSFPDINFNRLFQSSGQHVLEKIKCICHYFRRVCPTEQQQSSNVPTGVVTFMRRSLHHADMPNWSECMAPLSATPLHINAAGTIEDQGLGLLQVDFANKFLGGGVLGSGCVQEEIRFVICPELLISKLFTESLRPTEALLMVGCERYSNYSGYAGSFQWAGDHADVTPRDSSRRRQTHIVAIDALAFVQSSHQYLEELMQRELNKAYVGFYHTLETPAPGVASGNWGCGAFGGEATLKALLQLMACAATQRPLAYYTFGNTELRDNVHKLYRFLVGRAVRVCDLWKVLKRFHRQRLEAKELYSFVYSNLDKKDIEQEVVEVVLDEEEKEQQEMKKSTSSMTMRSADIRSRQQETTARERSNPDKTRTSVVVSAQNENSNVIDANARTSETAAAAAATTSPNHSPDVFYATSSSSSLDDDYSDTKKQQQHKINASTSTSQAKNVSPEAAAAAADHLSISEDSETDALLLAAAETATDTTPETKTPPPMPQATPPSGAPKKRQELRQRTLLEMLDQCYTDGSDAKRPKN